MKKKNNDLITIIYKDGETKYYTSQTAAGFKVGLFNCSVKRLIDQQVVGTDLNGREFIVKMVDGSNVLWKDINNY